MKQNIVIRRAKIDDIHILIELLTSLFTIETDFSIDTQKQENGLLLMLEQTDKSLVLVAEFNKKVVGMCTGQLLVSTAEGGFKVIVEDVVVAEDKRGLGIGSVLLSEIQKWAISCGANRMDLLADQSNNSALNFYNHQNWKRTKMVALQKYL
jgi:GNAT superfamily N-acetyltransferase